MKRINSILIFLISIASLGYVIWNYNLGAYDRLLPSVSLILVLFIPRIINRFFGHKIGYSLEFVYILFIFLAQFLGSVVCLYNKLWWYDLFVHFLSGIFTSFFALIIMEWLGVYKNKNIAFNILFMICFTLMIASLWEFVEFASYVFLDLDVQHHLTTGVFDTMEDMLVAFLGSIIVSCVYLFDKRMNNNYFDKIISYSKI